MNRYDLVKGIIEPIENGIFVEIGTHTGEFAEYILQNSKKSILYCVDPYLSYIDYDDAINNITGDSLYRSTYDRLKSSYGNRVIFVRKLSKDAICDIPDHIDFLYIDGNHRYTYVQNDLELYYPKVKSGCYVIGDDAVDVDDSQRNANGDVRVDWAPMCYGHYGVVKAFREFAFSKNITGKIIGNQYQLQKPLI